MGGDMSAASITTDKASFRRGVDALAKQYGVEVKAVMLRQVSIVGGQLIKAFPPLKSGGKPGNLKSGRNAIENDLKRVILTVGNKTADLRLKEKVRVVNGMTIIPTYATDLFVDPSRGGEYDPQGNTINDYIRKYRNPRTGRVQGRGRWTKKDGGRTIIQNRLIVKPSVLKKAVQERAKRIGDLQAGWLPTLNIYRGTGAGKKAAAFVSRHAPGNGSVHDGMTPAGNGSISFTNNAKYASRWRRQNDFVLKKREKGMAKELAAAVKAAERKARAAA
jgi:hypothetical protein